MVLQERQKLGVKRKSCRSNFISCFSIGKSVSLNTRKIDKGESSMKKRLVLSIIVGTLMITSVMPAFAAPKQMADGNMFDAEYYATNNPDVVAVLGTDEIMLYSHYVNCGKNEGRKPYAEGTVTPKFDAVYYATHNLDVVAVLGTDEAVLYNHYVTCGKTEGRIPCENGTPFMEVAPLEVKVQPEESVQEMINGSEEFPYRLHIMYYDSMGYPYYYHIGLNKLYISPEDDAKNIACANTQSEYVFENFQRVDGSCSLNKYWGPVGNYKRGNAPIYVQYIYECNDVILPPPEERGIFTDGLYWPEHLF